MPNQPSLSSSIQFISIEVTNNLPLILSTSELDEVITLDHKIILQIPGMPNVVAGVLQWNGEIIWLVDLAFLMGFNPVLSTGYYQQKFRAVKVKFRDSYLALLVQKVGNLINIESQDITVAKPTKINSLVKRFIKGTCRNSSGAEMMILDIEAIVKYLESA